MTAISWTLLLIIVGACWLFSMVAALLGGYVIAVRYQMRGRQIVLQKIVREWEKFMERKKREKTDDSEQESERGEEDSEEN